MIFNDCIYSAFIGQSYEAPDLFIDLLIKFLTSLDAYEKNGYKDLLIEEYCTVKKFDCNITNMKKIGKGSFGTIFLLNNKTVVKFPIAESIKKDKYGNILSRIPGCFKNTKDYHVTDFIEEQITNIIMYCLKYDIQKTFPKYTQSIPEIFLISKMEEVENKKNYNIGSFMEKLLPVNWDIPYIKIIGLVLQVANILYMLQYLYKFMHRDLHLSNIMLKKNMSENKDIVLYNGHVLKNQEYLVILIDFGNTCAVLDGTKICSDSSGIYGQCEECIFNKAYDLRMFIASLYTLKNANLIETLDYFFKREKFINHEKEYPNSIKFYSYYMQSIYMDDIEFYPENLIDILIKFSG